MQTTLRLNDNLMRAVKAVAASEGQSLTSFIEESLRMRLTARDNAERSDRPTIPVSSGAGGLMPGVDLDDSASLLDLMEGR